MSYIKTNWTLQTPVTPNRLNNLEEGVYEASLLTGYAYKGSFDASGGVYPEDPSDRHYWIITVAGTLGGKAYAIGDELAYVDEVWFKRNKWDAAVFEPWQNLTLLNGCVNHPDYYNAQITKNGAGQVLMRGYVLLPVPPGNEGMEVVEIPEAFRISKKMSLPSIFGGDFILNTNGKIICNGEYIILVLDGISYLLD